MKVKVTNKTLQVINLLVNKKGNYTSQLLPKETKVFEKSDITPHIESLKQAGYVDMVEVKEVIEV